MAGFLQTDGGAVISRFQGQAAAYTNLMDTVLRASLKAGGVELRHLHTNLRITLRDGGVDTQVDRGVLTDHTGWLRVPTVWQYKSGDFGNLRPGNLLRAEYVREKIMQGYGYRLALADDRPVQDLEPIVRTLSEGVTELNPDAPPPCVVCASPLAGWINEFPPIVLALFSPANASLDLLHLTAWQRTATAITPTYAPAESWRPLADQIRQHVDLGQPAPSVLLSVQGDPGIGKTRLLFEVLSELPEMIGLVVYTSEPAAAVRISNHLMNDDKAKCILVADECPLETRSTLATKLRSESGRLRLITVDHANVRRSTREPQHLVPAMSVDEILAVLDANYPTVPPPRRRLYAQAAEGAPGLAADMCAHDLDIEDAGGFAPVIPGVTDYLKVRLRDDEAIVVMALSLVTTVGFKGEPATELEALSDFVPVPLDHNHARTICSRLYDESAFVGRGGDYYFARPPIVAHAAFNEAWQRWAADDPDRFLRALPPELVDKFLSRVSQTPFEEVRRICGDYFRRWANAIVPGQLEDLSVVRRFERLVDNDPELYMPVLARLVGRATRAELERVSGAGLGKAGWGPRRRLVWLCERFLRFPNTFDDAQRILLRLALAEAEPGIANNATAVWCMAFRPVLSGTPVPFAERLGILRDLLTDDAAVQKLVVTALDGCLAPQFTGVVGDAVVAGRIPPPEWRPANNGEVHECVTLIVDTLVRAVKTTRDGVKEMALRSVVNGARHIFGHGLVDLLDSVKDEIVERPALLSELMDQIHTFLEHDVDEADKRAAIVRRWRDGIDSRDLRFRVVDLAGRGRWQNRRVGIERWDAEVADLAQALLDDRGELERSLPWLLSEEAAGAAELGVALGRIDVGGEFFEVFIDAARQAAAHGFTVGYVSGLLSIDPTTRDRLGLVIDELVEESPELAADLCLAGGDAAAWYERLVEMFKRGLISGRYLHFRWFRRPETQGELPLGVRQTLLHALAEAAASGDEVAANVAVEATATGLRLDEEVRGLEWFDDPSIRVDLWRVVEARWRPAHGHWWAALLVALGQRDLARAAAVVANALVEDSMSHVYDDAEQALVTLAQRDPDQVMHEVGSVMMDEERGWRFFLRGVGGLVRAVTQDTIAKWLDKVGVEGARRIARSLPAPGLIGDEPFVPEVTEYVLTRFEDDERVFKEFCAGVHSFQVYHGNVAAQREAEARQALRFMRHHVKRIRDWARYEFQSSMADAKMHRKEEEEFNLPD